MSTRFCIKTLIPVLLVIAGLGWLSRAAYFEAKAAVASELIAQAWHTSGQTGQPQHPWPWADFVPVGWLTVDRLEVERPILSGATGESLAFGLGHVHGTSAVGWTGNAVIAGHRNSWAGFLYDLRVGDEITVLTHQGTQAYVVLTQTVVSDNEGLLLLPTPDERLTLVTCYPRHGPVPSVQRLSVVCQRLEVVPETGKKMKPKGLRPSNV